MVLHRHVVGVALGKRTAFAPESRRKGCGQLLYRPRTNPWCPSVCNLAGRIDKSDHRGKRASYGVENR